MSPALSDPQIRNITCKYMLFLVELAGDRLDEGDYAEARRMLLYGQQALMGRIHFDEWYGLDSSLKCEDDEDDAVWQPACDNRRWHGC